MTGAVELTPRLLDAIGEAIKPRLEDERALWDIHGPEARKRLAATGAELFGIGGNCPVQAEGGVDGVAFYFRARGAAWEFWVGPEADWFSDRSFSFEGDYGAWPDAGWMPRHEALGFIVEGINAYRRHLRGEDEWGLTAEENAQIATELSIEDSRQRWNSLGAIWGRSIRQRPKDSRVGWTVYDGHERKRDDEWTLWRAILATIAVILDRRHGQRQIDRARARNDALRQNPRFIDGRWIDHYSAPSWSIAFWDAHDTYGGYEIMRITLHPGCRVSIFSDGECLM